MPSACENEDRIRGAVELYLMDGSPRRDVIAFGAEREYGRMYILECHRAPTHLIVSVRKVIIEEQLT